MPAKIPTEDLLDELRRLADEIGRTPIQQDMNERGEYSPETYRIRFGTWTKALEMIGHTPTNVGRHITSEQLLKEIRRVGEELNKVPSRRDLDQRGRYSASTYERRYGSWSEAVEQAGYEPRASDGKIPTEELIEELQRLDAELGKTPRQQDMDEYGEYSSDTYANRFGSWNAAIEAAGLEPNSRGTDRIPEEKLLDELRRLADELGETPSAEDMAASGEYSTWPYKDRFGSWTAAVKKAGFEPRTGGRPGWFGGTTNAELLETLQNLAIELERTPEYEDVATYTDVDPEWYLRRWDSWWIACSMAGVTQADLAGVFDAHDEADMEAES